MADDDEKRAVRDGVNETARPERDEDIAVVDEKSLATPSITPPHTKASSTLEVDPQIPTPSAIAPAPTAGADPESVPELAVADQDEDEYSIFSQRRKKYLAYLGGLALTLSTLSATIYFPLLPMLATHFDVSLQSINLTVTIYATVQAISPMFFSSIADTHGRRPMMLFLTGLYTAASAGLAANKSSYVALAVLRGAQSLGASAIVPIVYGIVADIAPVAERGALLGPCLSFCNAISSAGPIIGGAVALRTDNFMWVFLTLVIMAGICLFLIGFTVPETARNLVGNGSIGAHGPWRTWLSYIPSQRERLHPVARGDKSTWPRPSRWRPIDAIGSLRILLFPDALAVLWNIACSYTIYYTFQVVTSDIFSEHYGYNSLQIGLALLPGLGGLVIGGYLNGMLLDYNYAALAKELGLPPSRSKNASLGNFPIERARYRFAYFIIVAILILTIGHGWAVEYVIHPAAILVIQFFAVGLGTMLSHTGSALLVDIFPGKSSTSYASGQVMRCGMAAVSAAVMQPIITAVGMGWYFTIFAFFVAIGQTVAITVSRTKGAAWRIKRLGPDA